MIWLLARRYFHKKGLQFLQNRIVCVKHLTIKNDQQLDMRQWRKNEANHTKHKNSALFFLERFYFLRKSQQCKISKKQNNPLTVVKIIFVGHPIFRPLNYCCILAHAQICLHLSWADHVGGHFVFSTRVNFRFARDTTRALLLREDDPFFLARGNLTCTCFSWGHLTRELALLHNVRGSMY